MGDWSGGDGGSRFHWGFYGGLTANISAAKGLPCTLFKIQHMRKKHGLFAATQTKRKGCHFKGRYFHEKLFLKFKKRYINSDSCFTIESLGITNFMKVVGVVCFFNVFGYK